MGFIINPYAHGGSSGPAAPSPADQGAVGWWDISDGATVTLDGSSNIFNVTNKGSAGTSAMTHATAARRPSTSTYNGKTVGVFDTANNEYLRIENPFPLFTPGTGNFSIFGVYRRIVTTTGNSWIFSAGNDQDRYLIGVNAGASSEGRAHFAESSANFSSLADTAAAAYDDGTMRVLLAVRDGDNWSLYTGTGATRTPVLATSSSGHAAWDILPTQSPRMGGFRDTGQTFFESYEGQIAETGYFSKALDSTERDDLFRYFFEKWGT